MPEPTQGEEQPVSPDRLDDVDLAELRRWMDLHEPDSLTARLVIRALAELAERRAVVGAQATGPDQDEPAAPVFKIEHLRLPVPPAPIDPARIARARQVATENGFDPGWHALAHAFAASRGEEKADRPDRWYARAAFEVAEAAGLTLRAREAQATAFRADEDAVERAVLLGIARDVKDVLGKMRSDPPAWQSAAERLDAMANTVLGTAPRGAAPGAETTTDDEEIR